MPSQAEAELAAIDEAAEAVRRRFPKFPRVAVVLGSGLGDVLKGGAEAMPYADIPNFPLPRVSGHSGVLEVGELAVLRGRCHFYEGHSMEALVRPVRMLARLGVGVLILTNAAGTMDRRMRPGDLMLIEDHLNFLGGNPLRGDNLEALGPRFPDLTAAYDPGLRKIALAAAKAERIPLRRGVYVAAPGPSYETPAEVRMFRRLGGNAVGMSTVPEAIAARHAGVRVAAVSCITNLAAGLAKEPLSHEEVLIVNRRAGGLLDRLLREMVRRIP